jgi:hypothetical protein
MKRHHCFSPGGTASHGEISASAIHRHKNKPGPSHHFFNPGGTPSRAEFGTFAIPDERMIKMGLTFSWPISAFDGLRSIAGKYVWAAALFGMALGAVAPSATARQLKGSPDYRTIVPPDWKLLSEEAVSHERRFVSPSGDAWLSLYAAPPEESIAAHLERVRHQDRERITYERGGATWLVVSGYKGNRIFYRKAMLACGGQSWHHLAFEYPADQKEAFDQFVTRASYALSAYNRMGCPQ